MYQHILIATDGSELSRKGMDHGLSVAAATGARVTVLTVTEPWQSADPSMAWGGVPDLPAAWREERVREAREILEAAQAAAAARGVACDAVHVPEGFPAEAIVEQAKGLGVDLIVMASHGRRGLGRLLLGSQTNNVVTHSEVPVLVVR